MSRHTRRFPDETGEYRRARKELLEAEIELGRQIEAVGAQRRSLPLGGEVPTDYGFAELPANPRIAPALGPMRNTSAFVSALGVFGGIAAESRGQFKSGCLLW